MSKDKTVVVQPDSFEVSRGIAEALDLTAADMCEGIK
jgi:hypothetical protein